MNKIYIIEGRRLMAGSNNQTIIISCPINRLFYRTYGSAEKALDKIENYHKDEYDKYYELVICEYVVGEF